MAINRTLAKEIFAEYTKEYKDDDSRALLKIKHTYKVADLCDRLAREIGLVGDDVDLAWIIGLLHDVARFEQLRRFSTFKDRISVDHADLAVEILFDDGKIKDYPVDEKDYYIIRKAVGNHNKYRVEQGLDKRTKTFCDIIRDADKLDIFRVDTESKTEEVYEVNDADFKSTVISDVVFNRFFDEVVVDHGKRTAAIDGLACHLSLMFELVYPASVKIAMESGYYTKLMNFVSQIPETNQQLDKMREYLTEYINRRIAENNILDI